MKIRSKATYNKYYNFLLELKSRIDDKREYIVLADICKEYSVGTQITTILINSGVVHKIEHGQYEWNKKIPVSMILVKKMIEKHNQKYKEQRENNKDRLINAPQKQLSKSTKVIKTQLEKFNDDFSNYLSIAEAISHYGKSESTIRSIVRLASKKKGVLKHEALKNGSKKIYISIDYLDSIFNKKIVKDIKYVENSKVELGVIRKFLKWLW